MRVPEEKDRFIRIYVDIVKMQLYISVTNSMKGPGKKAGGQFVSDKPGSHGFGLVRIDSIVAKSGIHRRKVLFQPVQIIHCLFHFNSDR